MPFPFIMDATLNIPYLPNVSLPVCKSWLIYPIYVLWSDICLWTINAKCNANPGLLKGWLTAVILVINLTWQYCNLVKCITSHLRYTTENSISLFNVVMTWTQCQSMWLLVIWWLIMLIFWCLREWIDAFVALFTAWHKSDSCLIFCHRMLKDVMHSVSNSSLCF